jgi:hypothetical protein
MKEPSIVIPRLGAIAVVVLVLEKIGGVTLSLMINYQQHSVPELTEMGLKWLLDPLSRQSKSGEG